MGFSYANPNESPKDQVRFLVGDTVSGTALLQDEEIEWLLTTEANVYRAAAVACEQIATQIRNVMSKSVGGLSISYGSPDQWDKRACRLRARGNSHQIPYVGGISKDDKDAHRSTDDVVQPAFTVDLHDTPGVNDQPNVRLADD